MTLHQLGVGVIGVGSMGRSHVAAFAGLPDVRVVHVADVLGDTAVRVAKEFEVPSASEHFEALVQDPLVALGLGSRPLMAKRKQLRAWPGCSAPHPALGDPRSGRAPGTSDS